MTIGSTGAASPRCTVLYLERKGNPPYFSQTFLRSMMRYSAGAPFRYVHVLKGFSENEISAPLQTFLRKSGSRLDVDVVHVSDDRYPTGVLLPVVEAMDCDKILFLMSWSRVLADNWVKHYLTAFESAPDIGVVGATGGYERRDYRDTSLPFPNIGLRTSGLMIDRALYCDIAADVLTRADELEFESGESSLTKRVMQRGLKPAVVDRDGKVWHVDDWPQSRTFRSGHQEKLLIADNRTYDYDRSRNKRRARLARINWGDTAVVPHNPLWRRLWIDIKWRYLGM